MQQASAVHIAGRTICAERSLSDQQIAVILRNTDSGMYRLRLTHDGKQVARMKTRAPLTAAILKAFFARALARDTVDSGARTEAGPASEYGARNERVSGAAIQVDDGKGAVIPIGDGKVTLGFAKDADFNTVMEALFHLFRRDLTQAEQDVFGPWAGAQRLTDGSWFWTEDAARKFARGGVSFLSDEQSAAVAPDAVRSWFAKMAQWLRDPFRRTGDMLTPKVRRAYEKLLGRSSR